MLFNFRITGVLLVLSALINVSGCSNEASSQDVEVLGAPAPVAYLGVEYYYDFGSKGGHDLHNYTLSNHPNWLSLEAKDNGARLGVIATGIPGVTGGNRGEEDIGEFNDVTISVTDGDRFSSLVWNIEVKENEVEVFSPDTIEEGKVTDRHASADNSNSCAYPDRNIKQITLDGEEITLYPVIANVELLQPSVSPVIVTYELTTNYTEESDQTELRNQDDARENHDYFVDYRDPATDEVSRLLQNADETYTPGVVTFQPGQLTCYIRVYVKDDLLAEDEEVFNIELLEVIEGVATLGADSTVAITIQDNEPVADFKGNSVTAANEGAVKQYTIELDKEAETDFIVKVNFLDLPSRPEANIEDFRLFYRTLVDATSGEEINDGSGYFCESKPVDEIPDNFIEQEVVAQSSAEEEVLLPISFRKGTTENNFCVEFLSDADEDSLPGRDDILTFEVFEEFGIVGARSGETNLETYINEWVVETAVNANDFKLLDIQVDGDSNVVVLASPGENITGNSSLITINRFGSIEGESIVLDNTDTGAEPIKIAYSSYSNSKQDTDLEGDELIYQIGVLSTIDTDIDGSTKEDFKVDVYSRVSNEEEYTFHWNILAGSNNNDIPKNITASSSDFYVSGVTFGDWERARIPGIADNWINQYHQGNGDLFVSRLANLTDIGAINRWTGLYGTFGTEQFISASSTKILGSTTGVFEFENRIGSQDLFVADINSLVTEINAVQFGTLVDDNGSFVSVNTDTWVSSSGQNRLFDDPEKLEEFEGNGSIDLDIHRSRFGFQKGLTSAYRFGSPDGDEYVNSEVNDTSNRYNYFAGKTNGNLENADEAYLIDEVEETEESDENTSDESNTEDETEESVSNDEEEEERVEMRYIGSGNLGGYDAFITNTEFVATDTETETPLWTLQFGTAGDDEVLKLLKINDGKMVALTKEGEFFKIRLVSVDGEILTQAQ